MSYTDIVKDIFCALQLIAFNLTIVHNQYIFYLSINRFVHSSSLVW